MNQTTALLALMTETSLHAGVGSSTGVIDLPIQREAHTEWPCVYGSAVKGALRAYATESKILESGDLTTLFGPERENAADSAGALAVGDARLLLLPVRSFTGAFRWVTCPQVLYRFKRDRQRLGIDSKSDPFKVPEPEAESAVVCDTATGAQAKTETLFLEEYRLTVMSCSNLDTVVTALSRLVDRERFAEELKRHLTVVSDDLFTVLTRSATPVNARIAIDTETKTVRNGALWYEETVPPETLFYSAVVSQRSRSDQNLSADEVMCRFNSLFKDFPWLQLGGNETVGMGWCGVRVIEADHE